eukprot:3768285-Rhodomonas_salina.2
MQNDQLSTCCACGCAMMASACLRADSGPACDRHARRTPPEQSRRCATVLPAVQPSACEKKSGTVPALEEANHEAREESILVGKHPEALLCGADSFLEHVEAAQELDEVVEAGAVARVEPRAGLEAPQCRPALSELIQRDAGGATSNADVNSSSATRIHSSRAESKPERVPGRCVGGLDGKSALKAFEAQFEIERCLMPVEENVNLVANRKEAQKKREHLSASSKCRFAAKHSPASNSARCKLSA